MTKLVNLDELASPQRSIKFRDVTHKVLDLPLEEFVAFQNDFNRMLEQQDKGDVSGMTSAAYSIIERSVPTLTVYRELNIRQVMAVVQLIADFYPDIEEQGNVESETPSP